MSDWMLNRIEMIIPEHKPVRIYFKTGNRACIYGVFVKLSDHDEMVRKGFIRQVPAYNLEQFNFSNERVKPSLTKLVSIDSIMDFHY